MRERQKSVGGAREMRVARAPPRSAIAMHTRMHDLRMRPFQMNVSIHRKKYGIITASTHDYTSYIYEGGVVRGGSRGGGLRRRMLQRGKQQGG